MRSFFIIHRYQPKLNEHLSRAEKPGREFCLFNTLEYGRFPFSLKNIHHQLEESETPIYLLILHFFFSLQNPYPSTLRFMALVRRGTGSRLEMDVQSTLIPEIKSHNSRILA